MDKWIGRVIIALLLCNVWIFANGQAPRGAGTLSSLVRAMENNSRRSPFSGRSANPNPRSLPPPPVRESRFSPSAAGAPPRRSKFAPPPTQDDQPPPPPPRAASKPTRFEAKNSAPPPPQSSSSRQEFRFGSNRERPASRITFIPQDRGQRFIRPHQAAAAAAAAPAAAAPADTSSRDTKVNKQSKFSVPKPVTTTTRRTIPTTVTTTAKPAEYYDDIYDEYYDYYYYDDKTENPEKNTLQSVNLGPIEPPSKKNMIERERESRVEPSPSIPLNPKPVPTKTGGLSLSERLALLAAVKLKLSGAVSENSATKVNDPNPEVTTLKQPPTTSTTRQTTTSTTTTTTTESTTPAPKPVETTIEPRMEVRVTNTTESTFVVANVETSRSVSIREDTTSNSKSNNEAIPEKDSVDQESNGDALIRPSLTALFSDIDVNDNEAREGRAENDMQSSTEPKIVDITTEAHKLSTTEKIEVSKFLDKIFEPKEIVDPALLPPGFTTEKVAARTTIETTASVPSTTTTTTEKITTTTQSKEDILFAKVFGGPPVKVTPKPETEVATIATEVGQDILYERIFGQPRPNKNSGNSAPEKETSNTKKFNVPVGKTKPAPASLLPKNFNIPEAKSVPASLLPAGFNIPETKSVPASLLPAGFNIPETKSVPASLLPAGFNPESAATTEASPKTTTQLWATSLGPKGLIFPKRNKKPSFLTTTTTTQKPKELATIPSVGRTHGNLFDRVRKGTPKPIPRPTTPAMPPAFANNFNNGNFASNNVNFVDNNAIPTPATTTKIKITTTTLPPKPTTPGVCGEKCRLFATLRIIDGAEWVPELKNRDTKEWQDLAKTVSNHLNSIYRRSRLNRWFVGVEIDSFNEGSILVDYVVQLNDVSTGLDTVDLKHIMNGMLENSNQADYRLGPMQIDPEATDFVVIKQHQRNVIKDDGSYLIPEWLIAVIVISLASFLFIIIFGITVLVSRARNKRRNVPLTEEVLNKLNANQLAGIDNPYHHDPAYDMEAIWNEKMAAERGMKPPSSRGRGYNPNYNINIYDSWRTDWSGPYGSSATYAKRRPEANF